MKKIVLIYFVFSFALFAAPKDDFANVLNYAKFSSCEDIAYKFDTLSKFDGFGKLIEKELQKKAEIMFLWRAEITNGYQEGFFYHALMGIALESKGNIISAYNEFCYSLLYIDEIKALVYPKLRHEVELAIAKIYLQTGRLYDAQEWFDSVRIESYDSNILIAADSGLIARAVAIGDYKEACEMCEDLGTLTTLTRELFNIYAKVLFSLGRDRDAFAQLLSGIAKYGFDEDLGLKDPMVDLFLNALPRSTDDEIEWYYDLVGYGIMEARAQKGDENHLAMLLKTRMLFSTAFLFLKPENDMKKLKKRIEYIKTNVVYHSANRYLNKDIKANSRINHNYKEINSTLSSNSNFNILPYKFQLELLLMEANSNFSSWEKRSDKIYNIFSLISSNNYLVYDNTSIEDIIRLGNIISRSYKVGYTNISQLINKCIILDNTTLQLSEIYLNFYLLGLKNNINNFQEYCDIAYKIAPLVPLGFPPLLKYIERCSEVAFANLDSSNFIKLIRLYEDRVDYLTPDMYYNLLKIYISNDEFNKAFSVGMNAMLYFSPFIFDTNEHFQDNYWFRRICRSLSIWATDADLEKFADIQLKVEAKGFINEFQAGKSGYKLRMSLFWKDKQIPEIINLRKVLKRKSYDECLLLLTNSQNNLLFPWKNFMCGQIFTKQNNIMEANKSFIKFHENLISFLYPIQINKK